MYCRCRKCGRKLTDPASRQRGFGPECWEHIIAAGQRSQETPGRLSGDPGETPGQLSLFGRAVESKDPGL